MKRVLLSGMILMLALSATKADNDERMNRRQQQQPANTIDIQGKIEDAETDEPVVFASVYISGTNISTVSNSDGAFHLKVPNDRREGKISISHLGYENTELLISQLIDKENNITLTPKTIPIDEVIVRSIDPKDLILTALDKIPENYLKEPEMQTAFYREAVKQNRNYVSISEGIMDIYKSPYKTTFDSDRLKIFKGRKGTDVKKADTLVVKLQGGPRTSLIMDIVKVPGDILDREVLKSYSYKISGITTLNNRNTYIVKFEQIADFNYPLYKGNIYIDVETYAFVGFDFSLSDDALKNVEQYLVKRKPTNLDIEIESGNYLVRYRYDGNEWYLNYVRSELAFNTKWEKKLFKNDVLAMLEMAVTDRGKENIEKFALKESVKFSEIFSEQVDYFEDDNFWGDYNTIKPDESIEIAIERLSRKLKRLAE